MKWFVDGNQVVVTKDGFIDLQTSRAIFIPADSEQGQIIQKQGLHWLPFSDLVALRDVLEGDYSTRGGNKMNWWQLIGLIVGGPIVLVTLFRLYFRFCDWVCRILGFPQA